MTNKLRHLAVCLPLTIATLPFSSQATECTAKSSEQRVALLELYTSEGCNSCPPADRWLNGLRDRGISAQQAIALAFHVDYWDYIGWKDRFAQPMFSQRQRLIADRNRASFIYTPQFVLDGKDYRQPWRRSDLGKQLESINGSPAKVSITVEQQREKDGLKILVHGRNRDMRTTHLFVALYQNRLHSEVKAGENAGKKLYHEFVVRELKGPFAIESEESRRNVVQLDLAPYRDDSSLGLAVFAEDPDSGRTMQAMAVALCQRAPH
ncbi:MAG: DUF1223 domain-containing protein [Betaproteobacteria bacterium]|nr:MAG: DUF1223 domain-containing protein [Betaproteobacteria bacterium]